jgi:hypothetical protein
MRRQPAARMPLRREIDASVFSVRKTARWAALQCQRADRVTHRRRPPHRSASRMPVELHSAELIACQTATPEERRHPGSGATILGGAAFVAMVQTTDLRDGDDAAGGGRGYRACLRTILA